jgi:uncharacterized coiled-coil protein SlyX
MFRISLPMLMHPDRLAVAPQISSSGVPVILVALSALAVIGAATVAALPIFSGFVDRPSYERASAPMPDGVLASLRGIQSLQRQNAVALESLVHSLAAQQADLGRIFDQLSSLTARMDALQNAATPAPAFGIPPPNARAEVVAPSRRHRSRPSKTNVGVWVGGAAFSAWQSGTR